MQESHLTIIYDKDCPVCVNYLNVLNIQNAIGKITFVNAREDKNAVTNLGIAGINIDEGMVVVVGDQIYHGADAINTLALISRENGFLARINYRIFKSATASRLIYPFLKYGRYLLLRLLGRKLIN